jgi:uncharacterized membrane protein (Fun14 family)
MYLVFTIQVQSAIDSGIPNQISYGFVCGFSSGYALKKIGRAASIVFGMGFMTLQALSYTGYVTVNHGAIKSDVESALDVNDDGIVDGEDMNAIKDKVMDVLTFNMAGGSGFGTGFLGGFRSG